MIQSRIPSKACFRAVRAVPATGDLPRRVLFIDSDEKVRRAFVASLEGYGFEVDTAESGDEALSLARLNDYPLVALELQLPGLDGQPLIDRLRLTLPHAVFVVVTGLNRVDLPCCGHGEDAIASVVTKPWNPEDLIVTLLRAAESQARRKGNRQLLAPVAACRAPVLVVEDDPADAEIVVRHLLGTADPNDPKPIHVERLSDALDLIREQAFDVILADLSLPDGRGLDSVIQLYTAAPDTAIIVLSGLDDDDIAMEALRNGAQDYLVKGDVGPATLSRALRYARERKQVEQHLARLAHYDQLTGIANRLTLRDSMSATAARATRTGDRFAIMFLDIDRFKPVNDTLGHEAGDVLLQTVAARLQRCVREYDTVARLGGDEFAVLLDPFEDVRIPDAVAKRILEGISAPITIGSHQVSVTTSIGIATFPDEAGSCQELLRMADDAMYRAKAAGGGRVEHGLRRVGSGQPAALVQPKPIPESSPDRAAG